MKEEIKESEAIVNWIVNRIKKGLGVNAIVVGPPGMGKSYCCMRISELIYEKMGYGKLTDGKHVVNEIHDAFAFVKNVKRRGEPLTIEEVSVLASSRRSMASDNVALNYLLDTCRKKQVILLMNAPHIKAVDTHIKRMSHIMIECLRINKTLNITTTKVLKLQANQHSGKVYLHRFKTTTGRDVHRSYFGKPNEELIESYEANKDVFMKELYSIMEAKGNKKKEQQKKEAGIHIRKKVVRSVTPKQLTRFTLRNQGLTYEEIAKKEGVSLQAIFESLKNLDKKTLLSTIPLENQPLKV